MNSRVIWWRRLGVRLTALVAGATLLAIGALAALAVAGQERHGVGEVRRWGELLSETIKGSVYHHMLADQRSDVYRIMHAIGERSGIDGVRLFSHDGRVVFSTDPAETGRVADRNHGGCSGCHTMPREARSSSRIDTASDGHRILSVVTPIRNEKSCSTAACHAHPESQPVLGVIDLGISLREVDAAAAALARSTFGLAAATVFLLAALVIFFVRRFVVHRVRALVSGTLAVAESDLEHRIPEAGWVDELGVLARSFNRMTEALQTARSERRELLASLERQVEDRTTALRQAQDRLIQSEKLSSLGKLAASIAHEINNPLMGILTTAKLLRRTMDEPLNDEERASCLRQLALVQRETERCSAIVRNLLDFARRKPLKTERVDPRQPLEEALSVAANQMALQGIRLERELAEVPLALADAGQLRQAFLNIVLNACDAMASGGVLRIESRRRPQGDGEIRITDTGIGIAPELLPKIFDPFFTTKEKGTGLGLSVVYGVVERHGGQLEVTSRPGEGTCVAIRLPAAEAA